MERLSSTSLKKHTRSLKETLVLYGIGTVLCIYAGFLCGAVWVPDNDLGEFIVNFTDFIIIKKNFLVGISNEKIKMDGIDCILHDKLIERNI